jgi:hypothetical protein
MSLEMSVETFPRDFYCPTFLPKNKNVWKLSVDICGKECGKIKMSMETFHRHLWEGMWENKNVFGNIYGNFPYTFLFSHIPS